MLVDAVRGAATLDDLRTAATREQDHGWAVGELVDLLASDDDYRRLRERLLAAGGAEADAAAAEPGAGAHPG